VQAQKNSGTTIQLTDTEERRLLIEKRITAFRAIQAAYMPEAICHVAAQPTTNESESLPENVPLFLPSQLPPTIRASRPLVVKMEQELRYAQATDAIVELRQSLTVCAHLTKYKTDQVRGQHANTRARTLLNKAEARTEGIAARYRVARASYLILAGAGEWESVLKPLHQHDIRTLTMQEHATDQSGSNGLGEGHRTLSWIWITAGTADLDSTEMHEGTVQSTCFPQKYANVS
jgi:hypothetical protein